MDPVVQIIGTVTSVYPPVPSDDGTATFTQKLIVSNVTAAANTRRHVDSRVVVSVKTSQEPIDFKEGTPISIRGIYEKPVTTDYMPLMHSVHAPLGWIRYNGRIYS